MSKAPTANTSLTLEELSIQFPSTASIVDELFRRHQSKSGVGLKRGAMVRISEGCKTSVVNAVNWFSGYPKGNRTPNRRFYGSLLGLLLLDAESFDAKKTGRKIGWRKTDNDPKEVS